MKIQLILVFVVLSSCFLVDENNYFYINTSYHRTTRTISLSACFNFNTTTVHAYVTSPLLVPVPPHKTHAVIKQGQPIQFTPAFDPSKVGYNSFDDSEHWFGYKVSLPTAPTEKFHTIKILIQQAHRDRSFIFLMPLFRMPLNSVLVSPINTLYSCQGVLLSYLHMFNETDFFMFGKEGTRLGVEEKHDWNLRETDSGVAYYRHKSKQSKQVTPLINKEALSDCILNEPSRNPNLFSQNQPNSYNLDGLLRKALRLDLDEQL